MEIRKSILMAHDDGNAGFILGSNFLGGGFEQQTSVAGVHCGSFNMSYENDGAPRYRTNPFVC